MHGSTAVHCLVHWRIVHVCSFLPPMQADRDGEGEAEAAEEWAIRVPQEGLQGHAGECPLPGLTPAPVL